ncbi:MAG TPA: ankyrin repeat domain-containing protein [Verrucomicrobiales bacterium]|nr:ankyrin repeat domain-containing protein [Verrucomicrobiales bacterium]
MKTFPHSRRAPWLLLLFLCAGPSGPVRSEDEIEKAFRDALYAEEVKGDSEAALKAYQEVGKKFESQRDMAATALFRQGECLRKLGRKEEAAAAYNKVLSLYGDRERVAKLSRENLAALGLPAPSAEAAPAEPDEDAKEIARLKSIAENSPDLLNAGELDEAADKGSPVVVSWILEKLPKPLSVKSLNQALNAACNAGHLKVCQVLLDAGANPNGEEGYIPLWTAIRANRLEVVKLLLSRKADANVRNDVSNISKGSMSLEFPADSAKELSGTALVSGPFSVKQAVPVMMPILRGGMTECLDLLLKSGADVNAAAELSRTRPTGRRAETQNKAEPPPWSLTPLGAAIIKRDGDAVRRLLAAKADVNKPFGDAASSPLLFALAMLHSTDPEDRPGQEKTEEIIKILLESGADWKAALSNGVTALHICARLDLVPWLEQAIKAGADVNARDKAGNTALHHAVRAISPDAVRLLLAAGAKADSQGDASSLATPLTIACASKRSDASLSIIKMLLDAGADPNSSRDGKTPLDYTTSEGWFSGSVWTQAVDLLIERGARPNDSGIFKREAWSWGNPQKPHLPPALLETIHKVWNAAHWRDNPRLSHAVWLSRFESLVMHGSQPQFMAVMCDEAAVSRPPTLREFFSMTRLQPINQVIGSIVTNWEEATIIRTREGKEERIAVNMKDFVQDPAKNDVPLQWGDVVELPVTLESVRPDSEGSASPARVNAEKRVFREFPVELRMQPAKDRLVVSAASEARNLLQAGMQWGYPNIELSRNALRVAGISNLLFEGGFSVTRTGPRGVLSSAEGNAAHGDSLLLRPRLANPKPDEDAQLANLWLCQTADGPYWKLPLPRTVEDKPAPLAGLMVALLGPHPLPSACFDWDKATVRWFGPPPAKAPEPPKKGKEKDKDKEKEKDAPPPASVWNEKKLLDAWPDLHMQPGMVITLPPAERDSFEPPAKLRTALTSALAFDWTATNKGDEDIPCHYEPRFFRGAKKDSLWIWRDIDPAKANTPLLPIVFDLMIAQARSGFTGQGRMFLLMPDGQGSDLDNLQLWLTRSGTTLKFPW